MMKKSRPKDFKEYNGTIMSNFDREIDHEIANNIKGKEYYSTYPGMDFYGIVWWEDDMWHCEVWIHRFHKETMSAETPEELMDEVSFEYGWE